MHTGQAIGLPGERNRMKPTVMTAEELREYIQTLPADVILRVTIQEDSDEPEDNRQV